MDDLNIIERILFLEWFFKKYELMHDYEKFCLVEQFLKETKGSHD